ncbi:MAG: hypothetical protein HC888_13845 [Candidatus Competibacteraceae bacterium]|nr:hypothetical protein [Candidatus Competibacteraceae bacterium]
MSKSAFIPYHKGRGFLTPKSYKFCPAWGTSYYMSGVLFPDDLEKETEKEREEARNKFRGEGYLL